MTIPDDPWWREFIEATPARTAKLATVRADGGPHVAPIWVAVDGDDIVFTTGADTSKGRALRRDPRVALSFDDEEPPFSFVLVRGTATMSEDPTELFRWASILGGRYLGSDRAEEMGQRNGVPGELLVRVTPTHVVADRGVSDEAAAGGGGRESNLSPAMSGGVVECPRMPSDLGKRAQWCPASDDPYHPVSRFL
jgi:PPOX class probable F420-dependent enzyme